MKQLIILHLLIMSSSISLYSQELKTDSRALIMKEDPNNVYKAENITMIDVLQALEANGIRINKFDLGDFDKKYNFYLLADEYVDAQLIKTDTLIASNNEYHYYERGSKQYFLDYMKQIKIFTKDDDNASDLLIRLPKLSTSRKIKIKRTDQRQSFHWRNYVDTKWKLDQKVPLMVFASSWKDKKYDFYRFCGVVRLAENDEGTNELLTSSGHYIMLNYLTTESQ